MPRAARFPFQTYWFLKLRNLYDPRGIFHIVYDYTTKYHISALRIHVALFGKNIQIILLKYYPRVVGPSLCESNMTPRL